MDAPDGADDVDDARDRAVRGLYGPLDVGATPRRYLENSASFDLGLVVGVCAERRVAGLATALDLRYEFGLSDVDPTSNRATNRALMGSVRVGL